ncbi:MAG: site-specific integrase [Desulfuromonadales bacterium]|nr:site-specific integrase [Desulfuromonadales bacterium]
MATIRERTAADGTKSYQVMVRIKGFPEQTATFPRKTDAKRWAEQTESEIRKGRYFREAAGRKHTLAEMLDLYMKSVLPTKGRMAGDQRMQLKWWKKQLGPYMICDVTPAMIAECRDLLLTERTTRKTVRSPATVARYLAALSHAFSVAVREWEWAADNPVSKVRKPKEPPGRVRYLSPEEIRTLLEACKSISEDQLYVIVVLAISTGMRRGEILGIRWGDIDFDRGQVVLHKTKNKERRTVAITGLALEVLIKARTGEEKVSDFVFRRPGTNTPVNIQSHWRRVVKMAGLDDFRFHDLRHTAASYLAMSNATVAEIAEILGHKTFQMVKRYSHLSDAHTKKVVERMNSRLFDGSWERSHLKLIVNNG